jgi:hypothetical protein
VSSVCNLKYSILEGVYEVEEMNFDPLLSGTIWILRLLLMLLAVGFVYAVNLGIREFLELLLGKIPRNIDSSSAT